MKRLTSICLLAVISLALSAQTRQVVRGDCTPDVGDAALSRSAVMRRLPTINNNWDASKIYRQAVILMSFSDLDFAYEKPRETYDSIFNMPGYNHRNGPGCVADYFREQSGGLFNLEFDIYGPVKVSSKAQPYSSPNSETKNLGSSLFHEATEKIIDSLNVDFSVYDWNGDGYVEQIVFVYAGRVGNQNTQVSYGHIWPNTSSFSSIKTGTVTISNYTASGELWSNNSTTGIGTICHEFTHSLGLPDIYPTNSSAGYSMVDEWNLMDGGNFTNYGWCPPNYSGLEKLLLGWSQPIDLTEPTSIRNMKSVSEGGPVYRVKNRENEYYLLENRQWQGWDSGLPGRGLVVWHVNYSASRWSGNTVNNNVSGRGFQLVNADNMNYDEWETLFYEWYDAGQMTSPYIHAKRMNSCLLSSSAYPWSTDSTEFVNDQLTDESVPAAVTYYPNAHGSYFMSKPITNIVQHDDSTVSFDFMGGESEAIRGVDRGSYAAPRCFDLQGRLVDGMVTGNRRNITIVRLSDGTIRKLLK